ncbi:acyl-CoA dehydrogenase family protein [Variovorax sp. ZS18.2.2]|uniref:acyl-CoA dehydrogenase family protein n=1 Tax=Variovorax sp. ZS18.2.2 TaxID=2971255 RepID=UPI00215140F7|nr:acyl-CoA dehydrogenase family protein [Variovorax sp. ZS18.2.2]MCR6477337.1 acyl-CoA dehydrogenase family protein [Variovorax sp. ZS18.2.2]
MKPIFPASLPEAESIPGAADYGAEHRALCQRAEALVPVWREHAAASEAARCLSREAIAQLHAAGLLRILAPRKFGGLELGWPSIVEASRIAARACASTGWAISLVGGHIATMGRLSLECQTEVFADGPHQLVATASAPTTGTIARVPGGVRLNGTWRFASAIDHANWIIVAGPCGGGDDGLPTVLKVVVPASHAQIVDTWDAVGMLATGSNDIRFDDVFVVEKWTVSKAECFAADPAGAKVNADAYLCHVPLLPYCTSWIVGPILGAAEGALNEYIGAARLQSPNLRSAAAGDRLAESAAELACAARLYEALCARLHGAGVARRAIEPWELAIVKRDRAYLAQLCLQAVGRLIRQLGASGASRANPIQRHWRDLQVMASHVDIGRDRAFAAYASGLLDPAEYA